MELFTRKISAFFYYRTHVYWMWKYPRWNANFKPENDDAWYKEDGGEIDSTKKRNAIFIQKHYNNMFPLVSLIEDKEGHIPK